MSDKTKIEWTDATWNPITGCSVVSPGCTNCYAMRLAGTRMKHHPSRAGLTVDSKAGPVWTGEVRFNEQWLDQPLRWKKPRLIFACAHGDLFHENVPDELIIKIFAVMEGAPQHTFQVLTKRSGRQRQLLSHPHFQSYVRKFGIDTYGSRWNGGLTWPLPNVWLGVSAEDQARADERIPDLLATPAAVRFVSAEPLLGPINLKHIDLPGGYEEIFPLGLPPGRAEDGPASHLDWIIAGGESGKDARPMHPNWVRSIRDQCAAADVPFFFKQWGAWAPTSGVDAYCHGPNRSERKHPNSEGMSWLADGRICYRDFTVADHARRIRVGAALTTRAIEVDERAISEFSASIKDESRDNDNPLGYQWMYRFGKKAAGNLLDGRRHEEFPT